MLAATRHSTSEPGHEAHVLWRSVPRRPGSYRIWSPAPMRRSGTTMNARHPGEYGASDKTAGKSGE
jgi:hypothetical protein